MSMFCYQCQETAKNSGCTIRGVCGKQEDTANLQDLLIYILKGISIYGSKLRELGLNTDRDAGLFIAQALFATITNANFDDGRFTSLIRKALNIRRRLRDKFVAAYKEKYGKEFSHNLDDSALWEAESEDEFKDKTKTVGVLSVEDEDARSLKNLLLYTVKGICAYVDHAAVLGFHNDEIYDFIMEALASTTQDLSADEMTSLVIKSGEFSVKAMAILDEANTKTYGNPEITKVNIGTGNNPGILISGHDLKDMEELLDQTEGTGIDIYTHGEMLPANYYPAFKKYKHFIGNYGGSWWKQNYEFESFGGPILMTTNCIIPVRDSYKHRIFTTGMAGYPGVEHIPDRVDGKAKDFSKIIALAKKCSAPKEIETGQIIGGFAHNQVLSLADKIIAAVKSGKIKRLIVMSGCDGRHKTRDYFTEVAKNLPNNTVILTSGCAKYRYNKLNLGEIDGIPRILDAGQCNDSYSWVVVALKLKEALGLKDINDLPVSFDVAWYEQKAVCVLLALLYLGIKGIRLGPTLPAFVSKGVLDVLVKKFAIRPISGVREDIEEMLKGN